MRAILRYEKIGSGGGRLLHVIVERLQPKGGIFRVFSTLEDGKKMENVENESFPSHYEALERFDEYLEALNAK